MKGVVSGTYSKSPKSVPNGSGFTDIRAHRSPTLGISLGYGLVK